MQPRAVPREFARRSLTSKTPRQPTVFSHHTPLIRAQRSLTPVRQHAIMTETSQLALRLP